MPRRRSRRGRIPTSPAPCRGPECAATGIRPEPNPSSAPPSRRRRAAGSARKSTRLRSQSRSRWTSCAAWRGRRPRPRAGRGGGAPRRRRPGRGRAAPHRRQPERRRRPRGPAPHGDRRKARRSRFQVSAATASSAASGVGAEAAQPAPTAASSAASRVASSVRARRACRRRPPPRRGGPTRPARLARSFSRANQPRRRSSISAARTAAASAGMRRSTRGSGRASRAARPECRRRGSPPRPGKRWGDAADALRPRALGQVGGGAVVFGQSETPRPDAGRAKEQSRGSDLLAPFWRCRRIWHPIRPHALYGCSAAGCQHHRAGHRAWNG